MKETGSEGTGSHEQRGHSYVLHMRKRHQKRTVPSRSEEEIEEDTGSECPPSASEEQLNAPIDHGKNKWSSFRTRLIWTLVLIFGFFLILAAGHFYCGLLVMVIMITSYREIINLKRNAEKEKRLPLFFVQRYYWFILTIFGSLYGYMLPFAQVFHTPPGWMYWIVENHSLVTYMGALLGFLVFVLSLRRFSIKYQFAQLSLLLLTCIIVVAQGTAQIKNISFGLIWFIIPSTSVIANDISAYLCGMAWGRTKLIPRISPKKTVEGFFGASVVTFVWALLLMELLGHFKVLICPETHLTIAPFAMWKDAHCQTPEIFELHTVASPQWMRSFGLPHELVYRPSWIHAFILAAFASFVAPLGGFLASAFKRALNVKDFASYIPGHGGVTDRFDCQLMMGMFTYVYLRSFVLRTSRGIPALTRLLAMPQDDRVTFFKELATQMASMLPVEEFAAIQEAFCSQTALGV